MASDRELDFLHNSFEIGSGVDCPDIFLVEDDKTLGQVIKRYLEKTFNLKIHYFSHPSLCLEAVSTSQKLIDKNKKNILITDISFDSPPDGLFLIDILRDRGEIFPAIVMTGFASIETAISATKKGVYHYLTKPFDLSALAQLIIRLIEEQTPLRERDILGQGGRSFFSNEIKGQSKSIYDLGSEDQAPLFHGMVGRSKKIREMFERIEKVAQSDSTVLITGPSGSGKELVANAIHSMSLRQAGQLVSINCGAIPGELLESELFGHVKGAFTGALSDRKGRFEMANGGTLFLDEIGDMPFLLQVKLLRVLQSRRIERVGSSESIPINVRIITATHRDLEKAVREGNFREDLFYRLNVIPIRVPALFDRKEDIPLLISFFINKFASADGRNRIRFEKETMDVLLDHEWPGNIRELENLVERLVILRGGSVVRPEDLPSKFGRNKNANTYSNLSIESFKLPDDGIDLKKFMNDLENSLIQQALDRTAQNKNQASKMLHMNRTTLIEKLKKKNISLLDQELL